MVKATTGSLHYLPPAADWTLLSADTLTGDIIEELPVVNLKFGSKYKSPQNVTCDLILGDPKYDGKADFLDATTPVKRSFYIDFQGKLVYGGLLWARSYKASTGVLSLTGTEFGSFWNRQYIPQTVTYTATDQFTIARALIQMINAMPGGDIGIDLDLAPLSGILRDRTYNNYDFAVVLDEINKLSNVINGFDWSINVGYNSAGGVDKALLLEYPMHDKGVVNSSLLFDYPGNILDYEWPEDASNLTTHMIAIGMGEGNLQLEGLADNADLLAQGYPRLDNSYSYKDISVQSTLDGHAQVDLDHVDQIFTEAKIMVAADQDPVFGSYDIADIARFRLVSDFHPQDANRIGNEHQLVIKAWDVDASTSEVTLTAGLVDS